MSSTLLQAIAAAANWHLRVTENFVSVSPAGLYGINPATTTGLTLGYYGGEFNGVSPTNGTVAVTASTTNYVVAHRTTGVVTAATNTTNWANTGTYMQLYLVVAGSGSMTTITDYRQAFGGAGGGGGGGGSVAGSDKQIQYNASGAFAAEAGFEYDYSTNTLTVDKITLNGLALTLASATGGAGFRLPHGAAPTSPTNGDVWTTTAGVYVRINGATIGPLGTGGGATDRTTTTALATSGTVNVDLSLGDYFTVGLTGNLTSLTFSNPPGSGKAFSVMILITQDSTPRTFAWPASFKWEGGIAPAISTASGAKDVLALTSFDNGTTIHATLSKGRA